MSDLRPVELRESVRDLIERALAVVTDTFVVEIGNEERFNAYVQACVEYEQDIHLELMHESFSLLPMAASARFALDGLGWNDANEDFPNYWQRVSRIEMGDTEIATMLVTSLEEVYDIFTRWVDAPAVLIKPYEVAAAVFGGAGYPVERGDE